MNKTLFKLGALLVVLMLFVSVNAFAQLSTVYVNSTNGDDLINNGAAATQTSPGVGPVKTITKALTLVTTTGGTISIAAGTYNTGETAPIPITINVTLISTTYLSSNTVTITNGIDVNGTGKVVNLGRAADGSQSFNLGTTATALKLTAGALNIDAAKVTIGSLGRITRAAGTINETPTLTNVEVYYTSTTSINAGPECPASFGTGVLNVNVTGTVTFPNAISFTKVAAGAVVIAGGNATFSGLLTFDAGTGNVPTTFVNSGAGNVNVNAGMLWKVYAVSHGANAIDNTGGGNITVSSTVTFTQTETTGTPACNSTLQNSSVTGSTVSIATLTVNAATIATVVYTPAVSVVNNNTGNFTFTGPAAITGTLTNNNAGTITLAGGTVTGNVLNTAVAGATIVLNADETFAGNLDNSTTAAGIVKLNTFTLTMSKAAGATVSNTGAKIISATTAVAGTGLLKFTGAAAHTITGAGELPNLTVDAAALAGLGVTGAQSIYGNVTINKATTFSAAANITGNLTVAANTTIGATSAITGNVSVSAGTLTINDGGNASTTIAGTLSMSGGGIAQGTAGLTVTGDYTQTGGVLDLGLLRVFIEKGNWTATGGTVTPSTGTLAFGSGTATSANQTFTPIPNLSIYNLTLNNPTRTLTMGASLIILNNVTLTAGTMDLSTYNIRMTGAGGTFNSGASGYTSSGGGTLIWEVAGIITGSGTYSNMDIRTGGATTVQMNSGITFSGVLYLRTGDLDINSNILTFSNSLAQPTIYKNVNPTAGTATIKDIATGGSIAWNTGTTTYDLQYYGDLAWTILGAHKEWVPLRLRNLTINTGSSTSARTVTIPGSAVTATGILTVNSNQTLALAGQTVTLSGSVTHQITGTVSGGLLNMTGNNATLNGAAPTTPAAAFATVNNLKITGTGISVLNLQSISGTLEVVGKDATITMNTTTATITGAVTVNQTLTTDAVILNVAATTTSWVSDLTLTQGALTLNFGTAGTTNTQTIGGNVVLTAGTLTLTSSVNVTGTTNQVDGNIDLQSNSFKVGGLYTHNSSVSTKGTIVGSGAFVIGYSGTGNFTLTSALSVPNLTVNCTAAGNTATLLTNDLTVTNTLTFTKGTIDFGARSLIVTAPTITTNAAAGADVTYSSSGGGLWKIQGATQTWTSSQNVTSAAGVTLNSTGTLNLRSTVESGSSAAPRTFSFGGVFTQTAGNVDLTQNLLTLTGTALTRTAGDWSMTTGKVTFANAFTLTQGVGFSVKNLTVSNTLAAGGTTDTWTVTGKLSFANAITLNGTGKLIVGDGVTLELTNALATLSHVPAFPTGNNYNVSYTAAMTTGRELGATVQNFTTTAGPVVLNANVVVNGTLALGGAFTNVASTKNVTFGAGGILEMNAGATLAVVVVPPTSGQLNLVYNGVTTTGDKDWPLTATIGAVTFKANTQLHSSRTVQGTLTVGGTSTANVMLLLVANTLTVQGDMTFLNGGNINAITNVGTLKFAGATNTTLNLDARKTVTKSMKYTIAKTNENNTVTLTGADLDFADGTVGPATLYFQKGVLVTGGTTSVILKQSLSGGQPYQGFDISAIASGDHSFVYGRVKKFIDRTLTDGTNSVVTFPVGAITPAPYYRPMSYFFKTQPAASINLTVTHKDSSAGGQNGFPINAGTSLSITNYPAFFWYAKSDIQLNPSYQYDMEARAEGYSGYLTDQIQNVRFVRRDSGLVSNPWILQKNDNSGTIQYDNSTINGTIPVVKVVDATGGITTQGSIYSYSQSNKPPTFTAAASGSVSIAEDSAFTATFTATDPDLNQTVTLSLVSGPTGSTFINGVFAWKPAFSAAASSPYNVTVRAADNTNTTGGQKDTTFVITVTNVNRPPTIIASTTAITVPARTAITPITFTGADTDGEAMVFTINPTGVGTFATTATTASLDWTPDVANVGANVFVVTVTDPNGATATSTVTITVTAIARVPVFTTLGTPPSTVQNVNMGSTFTFTYAAADSDGLSLKYKIVSGVGTIDSLTGAYSWTVPYGVQQTYPDDVVIVSSTNTGNLSAQTTLTMARQFVNVKPTFTAALTDRTVYAGDVLDFTYTATDPNEASASVLRYSAATSGGNSTLPTWMTLDAVTGRLSGTATATQTAIYLIKIYVSDPQGLKDSTQALLTVQVVTVNITGVVTYGAGTTPVSGATVTLTPQTGAALTATTSATGAYAFNGQTSGTYTLAVTKTGGFPLVNVNAADALRAALYPTNSSAIATSLALAAADVNNDLTVNAADALLIMLRYVGTNTSFAKGDWVFVPAMATITAGTANIVDNVAAIAVGDVNVDAVPSSGTFFAKADGSTQSVVPATGATLRINSVDMFEIPVRVKAAASIGSMSMAFQYPTESATFVGVRGPEGMVSAANNGVVAVAWFNAENALNMKENDAVVTLRFKPTANVKDFNLSLDPNSQITDGQGAILSGINLEVPAVDASIPSVFAIGQNYPNPFNPSTTIQYDLPVAGHVTMVVYNMLGQVVDRLVDDQQNAGAYKIRWDASKLSSGVYMYHITVDAGKQTFKEVRRMVLLK